MGKANVSDKQCEILIQSAINIKLDENQINQESHA